MNIHIKLSSTLRRHIPDYEPEKGLNLQAAPGSQAEDVALLLGLPLQEIKFIMLNGRCQPLSSQLRDGDRLAFFPAVGGG